MDPRDFKSVLRRIVAVPVLFVICISGVLVWQVIFLSHAVRAAQESQRSSAEARRFLKLALDMETGLRGFLLNGDRVFLQPYTAAEPQVEPILANLERDNARNASELADIRELRGRYNEWHQWTRQAIAVGPSSAAASESSLRGKAMMDALRVAHDRLLTNMERHASARTERVQSLSRQMLTLLLLLSLVASIILMELVRRGSGLLMQTYRRHVRREHENLQEAVEARELLSTILRAMAEGVVATDAQGRIRFVNDAAAKLLGRRTDELARRRLNDALDATDEQTGRTIGDITAESVSTGQQVSGTYMVRMPGAIRYVEHSTSAIRDVGRTHGAVMMMRDVSDRRRSESALRSSERLALLGRLSATIAHEIRNPLDAIMNVMFLLRGSQGISEQALEFVQMADDELRRIVQIVHQLLAFNREAREPVLLDVSEIIDGVLQLFAPKLRAGRIRITTQYEPHEKILGLPGEIRQVFSNLVANAIDVLPPDGHISVRVTSAHDWTDSARPGVRVTIADDGPGIPIDIQRSLFTPFFTTKGEKGTGLGLWVSRGIVLKHEGSMRVRSVTEGPHRGTAFTIFLPKTPQTSALNAA